MSGKITKNAIALKLSFLSSEDVIKQSVCEI